MIRDMAEIMLSTEQIQEKVKQMGKEIAKDYIGKNLFVIGVLKGSSIFMADLVRAIEIPLAFDFMAVSSYGTSTKSSGVVRINKDLETSIEGKDVLIIEDIIDSGLTLSYLVENLKSRNPASLQIATLLNKPERRKVEVAVRYCGFDIADKFVVGYGLDYAETYRNLPFIGVLKPEVYTQP